jgi:hypothetical protein
MWFLEADGRDFMMGVTAAPPTNKQLSEHETDKDYVQKQAKSSLVKTPQKRGDRLAVPCLPV